MSCDHLSQSLIGLEMDYAYQVDALKDDYEELEENYRVLQKESKCRTRQYETLKRDHTELELELIAQRTLFEQRLKSQEEENCKLVANYQQLEEELERHKKLLEESEKTREELLEKKTPVVDDILAARETNKQTREYHYKWKMAEQENAVLVTAVNRLENQIARYKESMKEAEAVEGELKAEKRKLLRELRESQAKVEELETNNMHLQKRLDRIRSRNLACGETVANQNSTPKSIPNSVDSSVTK